MRLGVRPVWLAAAFRACVVAALRCTGNAQSIELAAKLESVAPKTTHQARRRFAVCAPPPPPVPDVLTQCLRRVCFQNGHPIGVSTFNIGGRRQ